MIAPETLNRAVDALAAVCALLTKWEVPTLSEFKQGVLARGQAAVTSRVENEVRFALAECAVLFDEMADSRDDPDTLGVLNACSDALAAIQRETVKNAKGWPA